MATQRGLEPRFNIVDMSVLRALEQGKVYIVNQPSLMRGFDYRAVKDNEGISLLIAKKLSCQRTLEQAYGRVGRYG